MMRALFTALAVLLATATPAAADSPGHTSVLFGDESTRPLHSVKAGDQVMSTDFATGTTGPAQVTVATVGTGARELVEVFVESGGLGAQVVTTADTWFWTGDWEKWVQAKDLRWPDWLRQPDGAHVRVAKIRPFTAEIPAHHLTVDGPNTYFVRAGTHYLLVSSAPRS